MIINSREKKSYLRAKWEHYETEEVEEYKYDENGDVEVNDVTGEAEVVKSSRKTKIFTNFTYNIASQGTIEKLQYIYNSWSQDVSSTIYTTDNIKVKVDDRIIINDKAYTIKRIYSEINDSTASMFNFNGYCVTYIELKGGLSL